MGLFEGIGVVPNVNADAQESIGIAGTGRVAQALGRLLRERGEPVVAVAGRSREHTARAAEFIGAAAVSPRQLPERAGRILIAVSDTAIEGVARALAEAGTVSGVALHTCGARGPETLEPLARAGVACGVLHPLQTLATPEAGVNVLPGSAFAVSGDPAAVAWGERIVKLLGGTALHVAPDSMPLYHAGAVMASNYIAGLIDAAAILMKAAGIDEKTALDALGPLVYAGVANALVLGPEKALTGPIERGDAETVRRHLRNLGAAPESVSGLYRSAGLHVLELARRRGLAEAKAREIETLLREGSW
jgi:predicted short-subunit dehydrogenase-like oxidoreductase (DUF2520 family)